MGWRTPAKVLGIPLMASLTDIVAFLDTQLRISETPDYPPAHNGLQLENRSGEVGKVIAAVDASLPVVEKAIAAGGDLLVVHHGMFWNGPPHVRGATFERIGAAIENGLAIYSVHIPLDIHPQWGNNVLLAEAMGLSGAAPFFDWKGVQLGRKALFGGTRDELRAALEKATGTPAHLCPGGGEAAGTVGLITGGAGGEVAAMAAEGIDTFITGEGPHWSFVAAEELGINVLYGGHYATETFGVKKLSEVLAREFGIDADFVDHPSGL